MTCLQTLQRELKGIILVVQIYRTAFIPVTLSRWLVSSYFWLIFVYSYFFGFPVFAEDHSIASHHFLKDILGITQSVTSLKKPFYSIFCSTGNILRYFRAHFWVCYSIFESCSPSCLLEFCKVLSTSLGLSMS